MAEVNKKAQPKPPESQWQYRQDTAVAQSASVSDDAVEWTASEFIAHEKGFGWFAALAGLGAGATGLLYVITKDVVTSVVICMFVAIIGVVGARKPRVLSYRLDGRGFSAGQKFHAYSEYKSFALVDEGAFNSITLLPAKRVNLPANLYMAPDDEERIVSVLGEHLPMQPGGLDLIDRLMHRVRF